MRIRTIALLTVVALSGCLDDSGGDGAGDGSTTRSTANAMGNATVEPMVQTLQCTSDVGAEVISFSGPAGNIGGCPLGTAARDVVIVESRPAEGCTIQYDENDDMQSEGEVVEGSTYPSGTAFTAFCSLGTLESVNALDVQAAS